MSRSTTDKSLTLPALYLQTLHRLLPIFNDELSTSSPKAQEILTSSLIDLSLITRMISSLGVFSSNEEMEDLGDSEMIYLTVPWVRGEVEGRVVRKGIKKRIGVLEGSKSSLISFLSLLESYSLPLSQGESPPPSTSSSSSGFSAPITPKDPAARREAKIKAYKLEKSLKDKVIAALPDISLSSSPLPAIIAILQTQTQQQSGNSNDPKDITHPSSSSTSSTGIRSSTIALLQLLRVQTVNAFSGIEMELELLKEAGRSAHVEEEEEDDYDDDNDDGDGNSRAGRWIGRDLRDGKKKEEEVDTTWRLDKPLRLPGQGGKVDELIDDRGRPLQPFTILPSQGLQNLSDRARLQSEVFRNGHRLPTMTIDEYLQEEERRGNFISGGGPQQDAQLTTSEILALAAEEDGTKEGQEKEEEQRQKEEKWARYTDENRKGEGNTMNRG